MISTIKNLPEQAASFVRPALAGGAMAFSLVTGTPVAAQTPPAEHPQLNTIAAPLYGPMGECFAELAKPIGAGSEVIKSPRPVKGTTCSRSYVNGELRYCTYETESRIGDDPSVRLKVQPGGSPFVISEGATAFLYIPTDNGRRRVFYSAFDKKGSYHYDTVDKKNDAQVSPATRVNIPPIKPSPEAERVRKLSDEVIKYCGPQQISEALPVRNRPSRLEPA